MAISALVMVSIRSASAKILSQCREFGAKPQFPTAFYPPESLRFCHLPEGSALLKATCSSISKSRSGFFTWYLSVGSPASFLHTGLCSPIDSSIKIPTQGIVVEQYLSPGLPHVTPAVRSIALPVLSSSWFPDRRQLSVVGFLCLHECRRFSRSYFSGFSSTFGLRLSFRPVPLP